MRCRRCRRELKDPQSIKRGIGPECWQKEHSNISKLTGHEWEQAGLFQEDVMTDEEAKYMDSVPLPDFEIAMFNGHPILVLK